MAGVLSPAEQGLWRRMSGADCRHAVGVARRVQGRLGPGAEPAALAAALLHDVGKVESGLGVPGRVVATLAGIAGRRRLTPRITAYLDHSCIGAQLLADAGSDPLVVAWAAQHHLPPGRWTVPLELAHVLKDADDD